MRCQGEEPTLAQKRLSTESLCKGAHFDFIVLDTWIKLAKETSTDT
jgi:hypothetical protein